MDDLEGYLWSCSSYDRVCSISDHNVVALAFGKEHSLFLTAQGCVYSFGSNQYGQLGIGSLDSHLNDPQRVLDFPGNVVAIACGTFTSAALLQNGSVYMWGENNHGQCGQEKVKTVMSPKHVAFSDRYSEEVDLRTTVIQIACSAQHTLALTALHQIWVWGTPYGLPRTAPAIITSLSKKIVLSICCGLEHNLAVVLVNPNQNITSPEKKTVKTFPRVSKVSESSNASEHICPLGLPVSNLAQMLNGENDIPNNQDDLIINEVQDLLGDIVDCISKENDPDDDEVVLRRRCFSEGNVENVVKRSGSFLDPQIAKEYLEKLTENKRNSNEAKRTLSEDVEEQPAKATYIWNMMTKVRHSLDLFSLSQKSTQEDSGNVLPDSESSSESFEVVDTHLVDIDMENCVVRAGSAKSLLELKQALRSKTKSSQKHSSLEVLAPSHTPLKNAMKTSPSGKLSGLQTEVWSWGKGLQGQLGHGNQADRVEPHSVPHLNGQGVTRVLAGGHHSLALTLDGRLFTWGSNSKGQLGHSFKQGNTHTPREVQLPEQQLIWDVSAGEEHTLLLVDARAPRVVLYGCGGHTAETSGSCVCPKDKGLHQLNILKKSGLVLRVFSGGPRSGCLVNAQRGQEGHMTAFHQWAASERWFLHQLNILLNKLLIPLLNDGTINALPAAHRETMQEMISRISMMIDLVALSAHDLTLNVLGKTHHWSLSHSDPQPVSLESQKVVSVLGTPEWIQTFWDYFQTLSNIIAMSTHTALTREWSVTPAKLRMIGRDSMGESGLDLKPSSDEVLLHLLHLPARRCKEYIKLVTRASLGNKNLSSVADEIMSKWQQVVDSGHNCLTQAEKTKAFWDTCSHKLTDIYCTPHRRLIRESKSSPLSIQSAGLFSSHWFILFNDNLVHCQFGGTLSYPLQTVWVEPLPDDDNHQNSFSLRMPEDLLTLTCPTSAQKTEWVSTLNMAIKQLLDWEKDPMTRMRSGSGGSQRLSPPLPRHATFTFGPKMTTLKEATYTGMWLCGKIHGHGRLTWPDGRSYVGKFKQNLQDGDGILTVPQIGAAGDEKNLVYEGHWKDGKLNGFGCVRYPNGDMYEGFFRDDQRHGYGMLKQGTFTSASLYVGQWANNMRDGYGVLDNIHAGEKYMGQWSEDQCHGNGVVVTIDGVCYEGPFVNGKLQGSGLMLFEDGTCFQGELGPNGALNGKGTLYLSNGDTIEGTFGGIWSEGIKIGGHFYKATPAAPSASAKDVKNLTIGLGSEADQKWQALFTHCRVSLNITGLNSSHEVDNKNAWEAIAIALHKRKKVPHLFHKKRYSTPCPEENLDYLEHIPHTGTPRGQLLNWEEYQQVVIYLNRACECPFHPLGIFVDNIVDVYRASYSGVGAHPRLLQHAVDEVHSFFTRFYLIVRVLFPDLPADGMHYVVARNQEQSEDSGHSEMLSASHEEDFDEILDGEVVSGQLLVQQILMPKVYQPLFTLYALHDETEDEQYWKRLVKLNRQTDIPLMTFLGVDSQFWLCRDPPTTPLSTKKIHFSASSGLDTMGYRNSLRNYSSIKEEYFASAVEMLQHISSQFSPMDKLKTIHKAFQEISKEVRCYLGYEFLWTMDYLFPVFQYVVVRARICHLGSEIHFIDDLMDKHLEMGELGIMFTTLKACYFQIRTEKLHI